MSIRNIINSLHNKKISFGIKMGLAGGAAYYIADQGVWKGSDDAAVVCKKISENITPYTNEIKKQIPYELPNLPPTNEISYLAAHYWNRGVFATFSFLSELPDTACNYTSKGINSLKESEQFKNLFASDQPNLQDVNVELHK